MPSKSHRKTEKSARSDQISSKSSTGLNVSSQTIDIGVQKANMCLKCLTISSDVLKRTQAPLQTPFTLRMFREVFDYDSLVENDWIVDSTLSTCLQHGRYQEQLQQVVKLKDNEIKDLTMKTERFRIYNILCEALRFCGDKVILPGVKDVNKDNIENATFLEKFEDWTQVTQYLRRNSRTRDENHRWLQNQINKVVESDRFYMWASEWHELFNLKLPRDQVVHAAVTLDDLQELYENAHIFGEENQKLVQDLVKRMHRSIPEEVYNTVSTASGLMSNPNWPRIR